MAYKHILSSNSEIRSYGGGISHFWNISAKVGPSCPNFPADVTLIQYMLRKIYLDIPSNLHPTPHNPMNLDGVFGPQTNQWIKEFQKKWVQTIASGKITPGDGAHYWAGPGHRFTIYLLNFKYRYVSQLYYDDLRNDLELPSELCYNLSMQQG